VFEDARSGKGGGIYLDRSSPVISGCRFTGGFVSLLCPFSDTYVQCGMGAAIACEFASSPQISGCVFESNVAEAAGGAVVCLYDSDAAISSCLFDANTSGFGGALMTNFYSNASIADCVFRNNVGSYGGAIAQGYEQDDELDLGRISGCVFQDNRALAHGGALSLSRAYFAGTSFVLPLTRIDRCTFSGNNAPLGGALYALHVRLLLTSSAFVENVAAEQGGAAYLANSNPPNEYTLVNCTFLRNEAPDAALFCRGQADLRVFNSILWDSAPEHVVNHEHSVSALDTCFVSGGWTGTGNDIRTADPEFVDITSGDIHLSALSPCADTGAAQFVPADALFDLDKEPRSMAKRVDVGADERFFRPVRANEEGEEEGKE
jgi:hypothetical protein